MWAITSYFNPVRYKRRLSNYRVFRSNLSVPLVAIELSFDGHFELTRDDADILIQISGGAVLWQKERLLNLALKAVPRDVENVGWLDCDVVLKRKDWVDEAERKLKNLNVIQLFSDAIFVDAEEIQNLPDHRNGHTYVPGIVGLSDAGDRLAVGSNVMPKKVTYSTGFAWAANREILEGHGFYDAGIVGSGDSLMAAAIYGRYDAVIKRYLLSATRERHYLRWAIPFHESVAKRIGSVSGTVCHLRHGEIQDRGYVDRHVWLADFDFDPDIDLTIGANGAWQWARPRLDLETRLREYFLSRDEDR